MIDISNAKFDFSKSEKYAIEWLNKHNFDGKIQKQYVSKTIFEIEKDGMTQKFELPQGVVYKSISQYMEHFFTGWSMAQKIREVGK